MLQLGVYQFDEGDASGVTGAKVGCWKYFEGDISLEEGDEICGLLY